MAFLILASLCIGCQEDHCGSPELKPSVNIEDYVFSVEDAVGDRYNIRVCYSLRRRDGEMIDPKIEFGYLDSSDVLRSAGSSIAYSLSEDGRTIWIVEETSSSNKYDNSSVHTVVLRDLTFGDDSNRDPIEGEWKATFKVEIDEDYRELCKDKLKIQIPESRSYYYELTSIQISAMGIHMEMKVPRNTEEFIKWFDAYLVLQDGSVVDLEMHHSIRGKKEPFNATAETMFEKVVELEDISYVIVCNQKIPVNG